MAITDQDLAAARKTGYVTPDGNDYISEGDDAISNNAALSNKLIDDAKWSRGEIPNGSDINFLPREGHFFGRSFSTVASFTNWPPQADGYPGHIEELHTSSGLNIQRATIYGGRHMIVQRTKNSTAPGDWMPWQKVWPVDLPTPADDAYTQHQIRQTQFMYAMGGPIDTEGKAAVAFRVDHGFKAFAEKLLPLFRARGIVPSMVYNPRNWDRPENDGYTADDLNTWVSAGEVEVWNHGADHSDASSDSALHDQIVNSLAEIEAELPSAAGKVWGFAPPGVNGTTGYGGYGSGNTPEKWDTYAGRTILKHHAVTAAYLPGTGNRILDGTLRDGLSHTTMEHGTAESIKHTIDLGITARRGVQLMVHPSLIDTEGYITTAQIEEVLDYVVAKRSAGDLVTLSPYQMLVADSRQIGTEATGEYDSGVRDITALIPERISGQAYVYRAGHDVWIEFDRLIVTDPDTSYHRFGPILPSGFRPARARHDMPLSQTASTSTSGPVRVTSDGEILVYNIKPGKRMDGLVTYFTHDAPPTALPGSPA